MAPNAKNVLVGIPDKASGGVYFSDAPIQSDSYPTDLSTLPETLVPSGFLSEDGVTETNENDTERIKAWGGDTVRIVNTDHTVTYSMTFLESSPRILSAVYGAENVTEADGVVTVLVNSLPLEHRSWALEMKDGDRRIRVLIPNGQITARGDITYTHTGAIQYEVTIEAFADDDGNKAIKTLDAEAAVTP